MMKRKIHAHMSLSLKRISMHFLQLFFGLVDLYMFCIVLFDVSVCSCSVLRQFQYLNIKSTSAHCLFENKRNFFLEGKTMRENEMFTINILCSNAVYYKSLGLSSAKTKYNGSFFFTHSGF